MNYFSKNYIFLFFLSSIVIPTSVGNAIENKIQIRTEESSRCFYSNGIPDHLIAQFPRKGNPHTISVQQISLCVPKEPEIAGRVTPITGTMGIAINGILFRPNTAGYWDPQSRRGHSRYGDKNWRIDIFGAKGDLGLDINNGHIGPNGLYHYHGIAESLTKTSGSSLIG